MVFRPILAAFGLFLASLGSAQAVNTVYVSPSGDDEAAGTAEAPLRSPYGALERVRAMRLNGATGQFVVQFANGTYPMDRTLKFISPDNGAFGVPLVFRGESKEVYFDGSLRVIGWQKATGGAAGRLKPEVRDKVFEANLPRVPVEGQPGQTQPMDVGYLNRRGFPYETTQTWSTLVFNGATMTLSRHPNEGWALTRTNGDLATRDIQTSDSTPMSWQNTGDIWAYGFFSWDWSDTYEQVESFDPVAGVVRLAESPELGLKGNKRYVLVNALEAIDSPGEFFIDRTTSIVYFYVPLEGASDAQKIASLNAGTSLTSVPSALVETYDASDVTFENITFQNGRGSGAWVRYGARVAFKGCTFRRFDYTAVVVGSGIDHTILSCDFYELGEGGVTMFGGDRLTLKRSGFLVENCHFRDFGRQSKSYKPAIDLWGVGHRVSRCKIEDAPHSGVILHGNNNIVEFTEFNRVCLETNDSGAIYIGRNVTFHGNKVWYNRFSDLRTRIDGDYSNFVAGVYLDDMAQGTEVSMNLFKDVQIGTIVGGGRDNKVVNNYFFDTDDAVHVDGRGLSWASDFMSAWNVPAMLAEVPYKGSIWKKQYSKLPNFLKDKPETPKRNYITNNVDVGDGSMLVVWDNLKVSTKSSAYPVFYYRNSVGMVDPGFADMANENYWFATSSPLGKLKIKPIDPELMGLYLDEYRTGTD